MGEHLLGMVEDPLPRFRQFQTSGGARQQGLSQPAFEGGDAAADRRLRRSGPARGRGEATRLYDPDQQGKISQLSVNIFIHGSIGTAPTIAAIALPPIVMTIAEIVAGCAVLWLSVSLWQRHSAQFSSERSS
nr:hypothetical protein [Tabrizicola sp.]